MAKVSEEIGDQDKFVKDRTVEQVYMRKLMFDLIDVNDGEKEIMKAWNDVIMGHRSVGLKDIPRIVDQFVSEKSELLGRLPRNFAVHLCALEQAGLITPHQVLKSVTAVQRAAAARISAGAEEVAGPEVEFSEGGAKVLDIIELTESSDEDMETESAKVAEVPKLVPSTLAMILSELGLQSHQLVLARQNISLEILAMMEDHELRDIGITAFGDRIRMRTAARYRMLMSVN